MGWVKLLKAFPAQEPSGFTLDKLSKRAQRL